MQCPGYETERARRSVNCILLFLFLCKYNIADQVFQATRNLYFFTLYSGTKGMMIGTLLT